MTYSVFGHSISPKRICDHYGLTESQIADCFSKANRDKILASRLIEDLIRHTPQSTLNREIDRRSGFRSTAIRHSHPVK